MDGFAGMTDDALRVAYNAAPKPNRWGDELLRRIHVRQLADWNVHERGVS